MFKLLAIVSLGFEAESTCPFKFMSRHLLKNKIEMLFVDHRIKLIDTFKDIDKICMTADIWSTQKRSFLGVGAHFIDPITLKRRSYALSCSHFLHPHSNERIAEQLQLVTDSYGLTGKVIATVTDNASNFAKALREFGTNHEEYEAFLKDFDIIENSSAETVDIQFPGIEKAVLSDQIRCAAHTLNLVGSVDIVAAQNDVTYFEVYTSTFKKLNCLWNKTNRPASNEIITRIVGSSLHRPGQTRWNSIADCCCQVLKKDHAKIETAMFELDILPIASVEWNFLQEFVDVLLPLTTGLDNLQQTKCPFGILLPTLFSIRKQLAQLSADPKIYFCKPLAKAIDDGIMERFGNVMNLDKKESIPAYIAAVSHPYFKLRWLGKYKNTETMDKIQRIFLRAIHDINRKANDENEPTDTNSVTVAIPKGECYFPIDILCFCLFHSFIWTKYSWAIYLSQTNQRKDSNTTLTKREMKFNHRTV